MRKCKTGKNRDMRLKCGTIERNKVFKRLHFWLQILKKQINLLARKDLPLKQGQNLNQSLQRRSSQLKRLPLNKRHLQRQQ